MFRYLIAVTFAAFFFSTVSAAAGSLEEEIVREMSSARTNPAGYADYIKNFRKLFHGDYYLQPGKENVRMMTKEGTAAVDEAIAFLSRQKRLSGLEWSEGLADVAAELAEEQEKTGKTGHNGRCGDLATRIERKGRWHVTIGENIAYGPDTARAVVMQLIIDDGVSNRGHRKNIYNPQFKVAGAACATHPTFRTVCVIDYAGGFTGD